MHIFIFFSSLFFFLPLLFFSPARPPSGWLALDLSGLSGLVAQSIGAGKKGESPATPTQSQTTPTKNEAIPTQSQATPPPRLAPPTDAKPR